MATTTHGSPALVQRPVRLGSTEMWASLAIVAMWLAVLFDAIFGPNMTFESGTAGASGSSTTIPSAVAVALFAAIATGPVAKNGFRRDEHA